MADRGLNDDGLDKSYDGGQAMKRRNTRKARTTKASSATKVAKAGAGIGARSELIDAPTPEQASRVEYERRQTRNEMGQTIGFSYHRQPLFETMAAKGLIAPNELASLRYYRTAFDRCERSPTKSCLNVGVGGGGKNAYHEVASATPSVLDARRRVAMCESVLGQARSTMRSVVLHDLTFSEIAIERFGGRRQDWIEVTEPILKPDGKQLVVKGVGPQWRTYHREKIAPRSGRHREMVRQEFLAGLNALTRRLEAEVNMGGVQEIWIEPDDACAFVRLGMCSPPRRFRLWGSRDEVAQLRDALAITYGSELRFGTAAAARDALNAANDKLRRPLLCLEDDELAA
ncbi:MAG: hypothetical protein GY736_19985 [Sphingomonas sp.]|uniref:hypothetical protein n=1 Tax=Sphingomonas sp. TaxID=28214 RepID=UPI002584E19B|nr:hypothetical protein [Sphingomonas sp.]MCP4028570.1 hypothetical protein [Sphingomonas sp.]